MSDISKIEHWRLQTLTNRISSNEDIAREYFTLANFIIDNYGERMETIQAPLLHIISHCMELACKSVIIDAINASIMDKSITEYIIHEHELQKFIPYIENILTSVMKQINVEDRTHFTKFQQNIQKLVNILQTNTTGYRYSHKLDRKGNRIEKSLPFKDDYESPNISEVKILFNDCYVALSYISFIISTYKQCNNI